MRVVPVFSGNIRVTVTFETSTGIRREEFAISNINGWAPKKEYKDRFLAKIEAAAMAAGQAVLDRFKPDEWERLEKAGFEPPITPVPSDLFRNGCCPRCGKAEDPPGEPK